MRAGWERKKPALAQWAADFSRQVGASLQFLHVVRTISDWLSLESEQELQEELRTESRSRIETMREIREDWTCRCASRWAKS